MIKKYGGYVLTVILSMAIGVTGTYFILKDKAIGKEITKTVSEVNITEENTIKTSIDKIYKASVLIEAKGARSASSGSGFVYKQDEKYGYVLTNNHVVENATNVKVVNVEGVEVDATVLGTDVYMDIAVLRISKEAILQVATIGDSSNSELGDTVFTVGSPEGREYMGTVTKGILSGKDREVTVKLSNGSYIMSVLQTDAAINPGNSGGPLVNINGEVIGINSLKLVEDEIEGMGFALPIEEVMLYVERLENGEKITRPTVGLELIDASNSYLLGYYQMNIDTSIKEGAIIYRVVDNSPAALAGLKSGDVIIAVDNVKVSDVTHFRYLLYKHSIGDKMKVTYIRDGKENNLIVQLTQ